MASSDRTVTWKLALDVSEARAALNSIRQEAGGIQRSVGGGGGQLALPASTGGGGGAMPPIAVTVNAGSSLPPFGPVYGQFPVLALGSGGGGALPPSGMLALGTGEPGGGGGGDYSAFQTAIRQGAAGPGGGGRGNYNAMRFGGSHMAGPMDAAFGYLAASHMINAAASTVQTLTQNAVSGRDNQWYDFTNMGGTIGGMAAGAAIGTFIFPGLGTMAGAAIGAMGGGAIGGGIQAAGGYYEARQRSNLSLGMMSGMSPGGLNAMFGDSGYSGILHGQQGIRNATASLAGALLPTYGANAVGVAYGTTTRVNQMIEAFGGDKSNMKIGELTSAYASSVGPGMGHWANEAYSPDRALQIAERGGMEATSFYLGATGGNFDEGPRKYGQQIVNNLPPATALIGKLANAAIAAIVAKMPVGGEAAKREMIKRRTLTAQAKETMDIADLMAVESGSTASGFAAEAQAQLSEGLGSRVAMGTMRGGVNALGLTASAIEASITARPGYEKTPTGAAEIAKLRAALAETHAAQAAAGAATGGYSMPIGLATEREKAEYGIQAAALSPMFSTNPLGSIDKLRSVNARTRQDIGTQLGETTNPAARLELTKQMDALRLEDLGLQQQRAFGWEGRIMEGSISLPNTGRGGSYRDALLAGHSNRMFGANSRKAAASNREWIGTSDATNRPGDITAQGAATVVRNELTVIFKDQQGTILGRTQAQSSQRSGVDSDPTRITLDYRRGG